jgi:ribosomal protein S6--L-glutamate ligase
MILSFHPIFTADENRICAGRDPDAEDEAALRRAAAVILPQGCKKRLYQTAKAYCRHIFPDYEARFAYPGKLGQIRLFRKTGVPHPKTHCFSCVAEYRRRFPGSPPFSFPFVFKADWGGEGETVRLAADSPTLEARLAHAAAEEPHGRSGFLLQEYVFCQHRALRVAVVGDRRAAYWRVQPDPRTFAANLSTGAVIDTDSDPALQNAGIAAVSGFCKKTQINLAGFDLLFSSEENRPLFLEINWFFGRSGLGGSAAYYRMLETEIRRWLAKRGLKTF